MLLPALSFLVLFLTCSVDSFSVDKTLAHVSFTRDKLLKQLTVQTKNTKQLSHKFGITQTGECITLLTSAIEACSSLQTIVVVPNETPASSTCSQYSSEAQCCQASCLWQDGLCQAKQAQPAVNSTSLSSFCEKCIDFFANVDHDLLQSCIANHTDIGEQLLALMDAGKAADYCLRDFDGNYCLPQFFSLSWDPCKCELGQDDLKALCSPCVQLVVPDSMDMLCMMDSGKFCLPQMGNLIGMCRNTSGSGEPDFMSQLSTQEGFTKWCGNRCFMKFLMNMFDMQMEEAQNISNAAEQAEKLNGLEMAAKVVDLMCTASPKGTGCLAEIMAIASGPDNCTACGQGCCDRCTTRTECSAIPTCSFDGDSCEDIPSCQDIEKAGTLGCCMGNVVDILKQSSPQTYHTIVNVSKSCNLDVPEVCPRSSTANFETELPVSEAIIKSDESKYKELCKRDMQRQLGCAECVADVSFEYTSTRSSKVSKLSGGVKVNVKLAAQSTQDANRMVSSLQGNAQSGAVLLPSTTSTAKKAAVASVVSGNSTASPSASPKLSPSPTSTTSTKSAAMGPQLHVWLTLFLIPLLVGFCDSL